jgi:hypothetical protein
MEVWWIHFPLENITYIWSAVHRKKITRHRTARQHHERPYTTHPKSDIGYYRCGAHCDNPVVQVSADNSGETEMNGMVGAGYTMTEWQRRTMTSLVSIRYSRYRPYWCDRNFFICDSPIVQWGGSDYRIYCIWCRCAHENIPFQLLRHYCHSPYLYHTLVEHSHSAVF